VIVVPAAREKALVVEERSRDVGRVLLVDLDLFVEGGDVLRRECGADRVQQARDLVVHDSLAHHGDDVVGLLKVLVVLQHHPALVTDHARRREQESHVDRATVERRHGQGAADVQRLEAPEHHAVRVLQAHGAERTCRTLGRTTKGQGAGDGGRLTGAR
jgi:hypothetical protein